MKHEESVRRPTIIDVAKLSGVSKSTVSNAIRGKSNLSSETRDRVFQAIEELGYHPNALARDLKRQRSATIGLVGGNLTNPFYSELARLIEQKAAQAGYAVIICDTDGDPDAERAKLDLLLEHRAAGIVMLHFAGSPTDVTDVERVGVPVVGISTLDQAFDGVVVNDAKGARLAAEHLAELGHRQIAYVASPYPEPSVSAARQRGFRRAAKAAGLPAPLHFSWILGEDRGNWLDAVLDNEDAPTAFFAGNDLTALELIDELERRGKIVPEDVSVIGFDGVAIGELGRLDLTTLRQPVDQLARLGMERLFARLEEPGQRPDQVLQERLDPELVVRGTTARPPRSRRRGKK